MPRCIGSGRHPVRGAISMDEMSRPLPRAPLRPNCRANDMEHRLTKANHPWTNGQVKRMNRTIQKIGLGDIHKALAKSWDAAGSGKFRAA